MKSLSGRDEGINISFLNKKEKEREYTPCGHPYNPLEILRERFSYFHPFIPSSLPDNDLFKIRPFIPISSLLFNKNDIKRLEIEKIL